MAILEQIRIAIPKTADRWSSDNLHAYAEWGPPDEQLTQQGAWDWISAQNYTAGTGYDAGFRFFDHIWASSRIVDNTATAGRSYFYNRQNSRRRSAHISQVKIHVPYDLTTEDNHLFLYLAEPLGGGTPEIWSPDTNTFIDNLTTQHSRPRAQIRMKETVGVEVQYQDSPFLELLEVADHAWRQIDPSGAIESLREAMTWRLELANTAGNQTLCELLRRHFGEATHDTQCTFIIDWTHGEGPPNELNIVPEYVVWEGDDWEGANYIGQLWPTGVIAPAAVAEERLTPVEQWMLQESEESYRAKQAAELRAGADPKRFYERTVQARHDLYVSELRNRMDQGLRWKQDIAKIGHEPELGYDPRQLSSETNRPTPSSYPTRNEQPPRDQLDEDTGGFFLDALFGLGNWIDNGGLLGYLSGEELHITGQPPGTSFFKEAYKAEQTWVGKQVDFTIDTITDNLKRLHEAPGRQGTHDFIQAIAGDDAARLYDKYARELDSPLMRLGLGTIATAAATPAGQGAAAHLANWTWQGGKWIYGKTANIREDVNPLRTSAREAFKDADARSKARNKLTNQRLDELEQQLRDAISNRVMTTLNEPNVEYMAEVVTAVQAEHDQAWVEAIQNAYMQKYLNAHAAQSAGPWALDRKKARMAESLPANTPTSEEQEDLGAPNLELPIGEI